MQVKWKEREKNGAGSIRPISTLWGPKKLHPIIFSITLSNRIVFS